MKKQVIIIAGPNGSGKTTCADQLLHEFLEIHEYVNADHIATELYGEHNQENEVKASKEMLLRINKLVQENQDFAFETTLAPRSIAHWLDSLTKKNYELILHFVWLQSPDLAVERVNARTKLGGHYVPEATVRRRYFNGIINFFNLYQPRARFWKLYDNSKLASPQCIAWGYYDVELHIQQPDLWETFRRALDESETRKHHQQEIPG